MELRFLEGEWDHGKFKLQQRTTTDWKDVPCVKKSTEKPWCEHIRDYENPKGVFHGYFDKASGADARKWLCCPTCGIRRPKEVGL